MKKIWLAVCFLWLLSTSLFAMAECSNSVDTSNSGIRETIRCQVKHIACCMESVKHRAMIGECGAIAGNIMTGHHGWASYSSLHKAAREAYNECGKQGDGCEELFSIRIHNRTPNTMKVYLFHPFETDFSNDNALWYWTYYPEENISLAVDNCLLFVSKGFHLKAEYLDKSWEWKVRRIDQFNYSQENYRYGQNLKIRLVR